MAIQHFIYTSKLYLVCAPINFLESQERHEYNFSKFDDRNSAGMTIARDKKISQGDNSTMLMRLS